jgi:hypothetical protein
MKSSQQSQTGLEPYSISLRIRHASIDPAELTRAFGVEPLHSFRAGDPRAASGQRSGSARHTGSYWLADLKEGLPFAVHSPAGFPPGSAEALRSSRRRLETMVGQNLGLALNVLVMRILQPQASLVERLRAEEGEVTLLIEVDASVAEPFLLGPQVLRGLADLGVAVEFEFSGH